MADGKVKIDVELQKNNFEKQLKQIEKESSNTGNNVVNTFKRVASGLALGKLAKDFMSAGISFNSTMESYTANFKVMLGSQEKATKKVQELKTMASKTPFEMKDLANATQTLLSFQVPAKQTQTVLKQLGDISLGNSEKLKGLALVFGQVSSAGKLTGQDLMQFINQGFNPLNYIAKKTGESMEELRDRMSKGGISAEEVAQTFEDATKKGGQFFNGMEEGSKTFAGQISTMKDNFNEFAGAVTKPIFDYLTNTAVPNLIKVLGFLNGHVKEVQIAIAGIGTAFTAYKSIEGLGKVWLKASEGLAGYLNGTSKLKLGSAIIGQLTGKISLAELATKKFIAIKDKLFIDKMVAQVGLIGLKTKIATVATNAWTKALGFLSANKFIIIATAIAGIATALGIAIHKAGGFSEFFDQIGGKVENFANQAGELLTGVVAGITENLPKFMEAGKNIFNSILTGIQIALPEIANMIPTIIQFLSQGLSQLLTLGSNILINILNGINANLPMLIETGVNIIVTLIDNILANLPMLIEAGISIIISLATAVINNLPKIISAGLKIILALASALIKNLPKIISATVKLIITLATTIAKNLPKIISAGLKIVVTLASALIKNLPKIISAGARLLGSVVKGIFNVIGKILSAGKDIVLNLWNGISYKAQWLYEVVRRFASRIPYFIKQALAHIADVGKNIVSGIWNGISSKVAWLKNKITSAFDGVKNHFKKIFDIHSPSKWSEKVIGENIMLGIGKGIDNLKGDLKDKVTNIYSFITDGLDSAFDKFQSAINKTMGELDLFGVVKREVVDGSGLLDALDSQVSTMEDYVTALEQLKDKGISDSLLEELKSKGLGATDEIIALSQMTKEELDSYEALYAKKKELAETINWDDYSKEVNEVLGEAGTELEELMKKAEKSTNKTFKSTVSNIKKMVNAVVTEYEVMATKVANIVASIPSPNIPTAPESTTSGSTSTVNNDNRSVTQNFYNKTTTPYESYRRVGKAFEN